MATPWHLVSRYPWTAAWVAYVTYLVALLRAVRGEW
jgi:hypothetical protein